MKVVGFDPVLPAAAFKELGIQKCDLEKVWPQADFITLHTPLTPDTKNLINRESLQQMKKGVHIINCARGGIVHEMDLLEALEAGHVGGAALDVYEKEPPGESTKKLLAHPNVSCTPHLGASTEEAQVNVAKDIAVQMCDTLESKDFVGVCNVGYMSIAQNHAIRPYADLAQQLGRVATQFAMGTVWKITLASWGQTDISITSPDARALLKAQALVGFLSTQDTHGTLPGIVNAPFLAEELGVETEALTEAPALASAASPYRSLITVVAHVEGGGATSVTGSVFGHEPCLVSLDHYKNFPALNLHEGSVLKFRNKVGRAGEREGRREGGRAGERAVGSCIRVACPSILPLASTTSLHVRIRPCQGAPVASAQSRTRDLSSISPLPSVWRPAHRFLFTGEGLRERGNDRTLHAL
ncbi:d-3-phosphoglycerate dehydrogenase [Nannochloropsis gaditana]|nr:d-3-phosphoglycerate dehydrogenase [Nannochloropsis gaditana]